MSLHKQRGTSECKKRRVTSLPLSSFTRDSRYRVLGHALRRVIIRLCMKQIRARQGGAVSRDYQYARSTYRCVPRPYHVVLVSQYYTAPARFPCLSSRGHLDFPLLETAHVYAKQNKGVCVRFNARLATSTLPHARSASLRSTRLSQQFGTTCISYLIAAEIVPRYSFARMPATYAHVVRAYLQ